MVEFVATVLTVYGIETHYLTNVEQVLQTLQQYLPFTVLKPPPKTILMSAPPIKLQQYLPFTVLKPSKLLAQVQSPSIVATVLTVYGIETIFTF